MYNSHAHKMHHQHHHHHQQQAAIHDSTFFFVGPFDDNSFCRGPQCLKPISTTFTTQPISTLSKTSSLTASPLSDSDGFFFVEEEDCAVLGDDDEHSEDELPPSPRRRHSGAMSISSEDLPFCYDRDALRRDTAAHRARHHDQLKALQSRSGGHTGTFAAHETWDSELDGPHMALWVPKSAATGECKRRRVEEAESAAATMVAASSVRARKQSPSPRHMSEIDGPMMALWGV